MNAMMCTRGRPVDFDAWRDAGCEGWGWDDVMPYFLRMEDNSRGESEIHGTGGPVEVIDQVDPRPLTRRFLDAAVEAGIPANPDVNAPEQDGVTQTQVFQRNGRRWSAADAYLRPAMKRPNLTVKTNVHALGLDARRQPGARGARARQAWARGGRPGRARGDPRRRRDRQPAAPDALGDRRRRRAARGRRRAAGRPARRRQQPPGPPVPHALLRVDGPRRPRRRGEAGGAASSGSSAAAAR